jgi:adenosine deaminase
MKSLLQQLPKSELHLHLRGAVPPEVFADLFNKYGPEAAIGSAPDSVKDTFRRCPNIRPFLSRRRCSPEHVSNLFRYQSFEHFLFTYFFTGFFIRSPDDLQHLIAGVLESLRAQNIVYAEITVSAIEYVRHGLPLARTVGCLDQGAAHPRLRLQWIIDLVRDSGPDAALAQLEEIIHLRCPSIIGITLGGSEHRFPPGRFSRVYALARDHGLRLSIHAGEAAGPDSVREALDTLQVERIGHGVRAVEDESLVRRLAADGIPLEVCPTSNIATGIYSSLAAHPIKALFDAGVPVTVNSDDPTFFNTTLADEYASILPLGFTSDDVLQLLRNAFTYSFLPRDAAARYLAHLDSEWQALTSRHPPAPP